MGQFRQWLEMAAPKFGVRKLLQLIGRLPPNLKTAATGGDCGAFAVALAGFLADRSVKVELGAVVDVRNLQNIKSQNPDTLMWDLSQGEPTIAHVFVWAFGGAYDAEGVVTEPGLIPYCKEYGISGQIIAYNPTKLNIQATHSETKYSHDATFYYGVINKLWSESVQTEAALDADKLKRVRRKHLQPVVRQTAIYT
jgi:hypothetical protein